MKINQINQKIINSSGYVWSYMNPKCSVLPKPVAATCYLLSSALQYLIWIEQQENSPFSHSLTQLFCSSHVNKALIHSLKQRLSFYVQQGQGSACSPEQKQAVSGEKCWCEIVYSLVSKFRSHKEKASLQHAHGSSHRNGVEVLESNLCHLKADEDVTVLAEH